MLPDAAYLQEEEARYANRKGYSKHAPALPLYTVEHAEAALKLLRPVRFGEKVEVANGVVLDFGRVGHILGAGSARFNFAVNGQQKTLIDSGDLGRYERPILKDPESWRRYRLAVDRVDLRQSNTSERFRSRAARGDQTDRGGAALFDHSRLRHRPHSGFALHHSQDGR
jgi:hypothetical protein